MTARGIIFSAESVRAILDGRKSQTRRLSKGQHFACPHGEPGDRLWVREEWAIGDPLRFVDHCRDGVAYRAVDGNQPHSTERWRSPLFMPRWASRITLEITRVRVERLQAIGEDDARAEGAASVAEYAGVWDAINRRKAPWALNPWVWAIEFRRVTP